MPAALPALPEGEPSDVIFLAKYTRFNAISTIIAHSSCLSLWERWIQPKAEDGEGIGAFFLFLPLSRQYRLWNITFYSMITGITGFVY